CRSVLGSLYDRLKGRVRILFGEEARTLIVDGGEFKGVELASGRRILAGFGVIAPGRAGVEWLHGEFLRLKLVVENNAVDIGVRVEVPASVTDDITSISHEVKLLYTSRHFDDPVRTFCMNPRGEVVEEHLEDIVTVNGHSYRNNKTDRTNFALLVSTRFTEPFKDPIAYGKSIARLANLIGGGVLVQRLGDLLAGRRSTVERIGRNLIAPSLTSATPGDLSFVLPYRYLTDILEMLEALDALISGIWQPYTLLYGVEVKFYSVRPRLTRELESEIANMFVVGDGAGISRGLVQASASGLIAADAIAAKLHSSNM
ncbi:MAG TPA: FAD-dependent oxidoreductase, partial [Proteobacteria bacterium]|nr:FAD-dependent oxidoreductase [Pseudomonadota bacterium]